MGLAAALLAASLAAPDARVELGRRLFMDPTVSRTGKVSCSSCHLPDHGFSDPRARSKDETGTTRRHSQPILDLGETGAFHWDGEFASVRELIDARLAPAWRLQAITSVARARRFEEARAASRNPDEKLFRKALDGIRPYGSAHRGGPEAATLRRRLGSDQRYNLGFRAAFGTTKITPERIAEAIEAYVLSVRSGVSPFDRHRAGERDALTEAQRRGLALFTGRAGCARCHLAEGQRPPFTDGGFHNTGISIRNIRRSLDVGASAIDFVAADWCKFKTPTLRDVARRAPYMHDGSFATLEDVIRYYDSGAAPWMLPLGLSLGERSDLVAFLQSLTSDERPGLGPALPKRRHAWLKVEDLEGEPLRRLGIEIRPAGDRLQGARVVEKPQLAFTDMSGGVSFDFPAWTHVQLAAPDFEIDYDWLVPDFVTSMQAIAAPKTKVTLKLRLACDCVPEKLDAVVGKACGTPGTTVARFRLVRRLPDGSALYVAPRPSRARGPAVVELRAAEPDEPRTVAAAVEIDLSGGWAEPLELRPEAGEPVACDWCLGK